jgi:hypothetical protein
MSQNSFFSYIHPSAVEMDLRGKPEFVQDYYRDKKDKIIHELVYETGLPKRFEVHDAIDTNPYHLLFYMLARFYFVDNGTDEIVYYYAKRDRYLVEAALAALPPRFKRLTEREEGVEYVALPGCRYYVDSIEEPWIYMYVNSLFNHLCQDSPRQKGIRIFISREFATERRLPMPPEFVRHLLEMGFSIYSLETMSFVDQLRLFRSAEVVAGPHGAGLAWITFCEPGTLVVELCPPVEGKNHYKHISESLNLHYVRLPMCSFEGPTHEFNLDTPYFFTMLGHILEQYKPLSNKSQA